MSTNFHVNTLSVCDVTFFQDRLRILKIKEQSDLSASAALQRQQLDYFSGLKANHDNDLEVSKKVDIFFEP